VSEFSGELEMNTQDEQPVDVSLRVNVKADSLALVESVSAKDRNDIESTMRRDVLETASYPKIVYASKDIAAETIFAGWYRIRAKGMLELHGISRPHSIDAQLRIMEDGMRLSGEFVIKLSAYHIKRVTALGGLISLQDDLKSVFDIFGRPQ
jgi:polyisoprenoid-binding protein YceI